MFSAITSVDRAKGPTNTAENVCYLRLVIRRIGDTVRAAGDRKTHAAEQRARAFAAEVLLPLDGLTRKLGTPRAVTDPSPASALVATACSTFGTPHEITTNHLCNHGFVDLALHSWLEAEKTTFAGVDAGVVDDVAAVALDAGQKPTWWASWRGLAG